MKTPNPYQEVIDWLQSPEGTSWSENRIWQAKITAGDTAAWVGTTSYGDRQVMWMGGVMSVKEG